MIGPREIKEKLERQWSSGHLLRAKLEPNGEDAARFPWTLRFKKPRSSEWLTHFAELRERVAELRDASVDGGRRGFRIEWQTIQHRKLGAQRLPARIVVDSPDDALHVICKRRAAERCIQIVTELTTHFPKLKTWCINRPLTVIEHESEWERIIRVLDWFRNHQKSGLYLRQLDIPDVDTKFIEQRRKLFAELLRLVLPASAIDEGPALLKDAWFEHRFGLRYDHPRVRVRGLALQAHIGLTDVTLGTDALAKLPVARRVFVVENKVSGLAFPDIPDSICMMGLGYGVSVLAQVPWLEDVELYYWGDIDTHGFAILSALRRVLPNAHSLLMDERTLKTWESLAVTENAPSTRLENQAELLTPDEYRLANALLPGGVWASIRLEQERLPISYLRRRLDEVLANT